MRHLRRKALAVAPLALVATIGAMTFGPAGVEAIVSDHPIALSPTTPAAGSAFTASGDDCDALQYAPAVRNLLTGSTATGVDTAPVGGHWTTDYAADWNDDLGPGWQVVGTQCDPDGEDWTSATFFVAGPTPVLPMSIHLGETSDGELDGTYYATGSDCPTDTLLLDDITGDVEGFRGSTGVDGDGTWSFDLGAQDPAADHLIAGCVDDAGMLEQLYEYGGASAPTTPTTPTTPIVPTTTPVDPASAPVAQSVVVQPALTG